MSGKKKKIIKNDLVRDSVNTFGTNIIGSALGLFSSIIILSNVPRSVKGLYNQVQIWGGGFNTVLGLSVSSAVVYYIAKYTTENAAGAVKKLTAYISAAIVIISSLLLFILRDNPMFDSTPVQYLAAIVAYGLLSFVFTICSMVLRGQNKFKSYNMVNLTQRILVTVLAVVIFIKPSASVWVWSTVAISGAMVVFSLYCIKRWNGERPKPAPENDTEVKAGSMVAYSIKSHVSNVLNYLNINTGNYIVQGLYELSDLAVYNTALTLMQQVWILPDAVSQVILSRIAAMRENKGKVKLTLISAKVVVYVTTAVALLLLLAAKIFLPILFPMYKGAVEPLKYLIVGSIFISYAKVLGNSIAAYGRPELNIIPNVLGFIVNCGLDFALVPVMGINGVAAATSASLTVQGISCIAIFCIYSHTPFYKLFVPNREELSNIKNAVKK